MRKTLAFSTLIPVLGITLALLLNPDTGQTGTYVDGQSENSKDIVSLDSRVDGIQAATGSYATVTYVNTKTNLTKILSTNLAAQSAANLYTPLVTYRSGTNTVRILATNQADTAAATRDVAATNAVRIMGDARWVGKSETNAFRIATTNAAVQAANTRTTAATNDILNGSTFSGDLKVSTNAHIDSAVGSSSYILGNTGIGTNNPAVKLHVRGEVRASDGISFGTSNFVMKSGTYLGSNGVYFVDGATTNWLLWP